MPYHKLLGDTIHMTHESGFFSCCSVRLDAIIQYFNENNFKLPGKVDSTKSYTWYKKNKNDEIYDFFICDKNMDVSFTSNVVNYKQTDQWIDYRKLDINLITPFIKKYFTPTPDIYQNVKNIEEKYNIDDYSNLCVLFYRGNDKQAETKYRKKNLASYHKYLTDAYKIIKTFPDTRFLIQSDETEFIDTMLEKIPNSFILTNEIRHMKNNPKTTVDKVFKYTHEYSKKFLAIILIMAKCNHIILNNGNCGIWTVFYRGNTNNVIQLSPS
jgi:hypothetical protein